MTLPRPSQVAPYYGDDYHGDRHRASGSFANRRRLAWVEAVIPVDQPRLIDVGCGDGSFLVAARRRAWLVAGTELHPNDARAKDLRVESDLLDLDDLGPVDVITFWHSLEHLGDPRAALRAAASRLRPGGVVLLAVPNFDSLQSRVTRASWLHLDAPRHLWHFNARALRARLADANLDPIRWWHLELEYDLAGWAQSLQTPFTGGRTLFFDQLTGRSPAGSGRARAGSMAAGVVLSALTLPLVPVTTLSGRGAVVAVAARVRP